MLLTISTSHAPATDLGFLLHKHPDRIHERTVPFGTKRVCYPEAGPDRCTAALVVEVDPVGLVRRRGHRGRHSSLGHYVNDRPSVASSFLATAITEMFATALAGRSAERPDLAATAIPLVVHLPVLPCRGGEAVLRSLLEPLGYDVDATALPLDTSFPAWGDSRYLDVTLTTCARVRDVLAHLVVLLPVLDDDKHHWVDRSEIDRLLHRGGEWLAAHPARELITRRFLRHDRALTREALARLVEADGTVADPDGEQVARDQSEATIERPVRLQDLRIAAVTAALREAGARRIADVGCGEGALVRALLREPWVEHVVGVDVSWRALELAGRRLKLDEMAPRQRERIELRQGALTYRDGGLRQVDAVALVEVVEHVDPLRLGALEDAVFAAAHPATAVVTTPNVEYNSVFGLTDRLRHADHRFEWTRAEFAAWCDGVAGRHDYRVTVTGIGPVDDVHGSPTQMAVFRR